MRASAYVALPPRLVAALEGGATVVTPNKRLARRLVALYDAEQQAAGRAAWPACTVLPWPAWIDRLWLDMLAEGGDDPMPTLLAPAQSALLWHDIVGADALAPGLIDPRGAAALAAQAWGLLHAWGAGGESWRGFAEGSDDPARFADWAEAFARALARRGAIDRSRLPDHVARASRSASTASASPIVLAGFVEYAPQQERLLTALEAQGARVERLSTLRREIGAVKRADAATPSDEVARALEWARTRALADPHAVIGVAVIDLAARHEEIRALAEDILCPALQWPARGDAPRPYNLSLGAPLGAIPIAATALDLVALAHSPLSMPRAAALLRSPYLVGAGAGEFARASIERAWLQEGRRDVSLGDAVGALAGCDAALSARWRAARACLPDVRVAPARAWSDTWRAWLAAAGWPGDRTPSSAEWQARGAFDELLADFARLGPVATRMRGDEAARTLAALAADRIFQPEAPAAPIQILGLLEAAALPLDALWVTGLTAEAWPAAPHPHPLLPVAWQRERLAPHASPERERTYAAALTEQFLRAASEVVLSHPRSVDDHPRSPSRLIPDVDLMPERAAPVTTARLQFAAALILERRPDDRAPPFPAGTKGRGGAALVEAQADCPFKAAAVFRLRAEPWPDPVDGFAALERGLLVHEALATFWRDIGSRDAFAALPPAALRTRIGACVAAAIERVPAARRKALPPVVRDGESGRLEALVAAWLDGCERERPPFSVRDVELRLSYALSRLPLDLRVDRVDVLANGALAIIDYKTGRVARPARWLESRPRAPQLGLYLLALRAMQPVQPVSGVAYALLRPGEMKFEGLVADRAPWPQLVLPEEAGGPEFRDWQAVEARLAQTLAAMADEFVAGDAMVSPRDGSRTCERCGLQALCRIGALAADAGTEDGDA